MDGLTAVFRRYYGQFKHCLFFQSLIKEKHTSQACQFSNKELPCFNGKLCSVFGFLFSEAACDVLKGFPSLSVISAYLGGNWYLALGKLFGKNLLCEARNTKTCLWERGKEQLITRTRNQSYIHLTDVIWRTYDWSDQLMINNIQFKK